MADRILLAVLALMLLATLVSAGVQAWQAM
jgi:hypothetical protein